MGPKKTPRVSECTYSTLEQHNFSHVGPLTCGLFSPINTSNVFSLPYIFLITLFSLGYFIIRVQSMTHITNKTRINQLFM